MDTRKTYTRRAFLSGSALGLSGLLSACSQPAPEPAPEGSAEQGSAEPKIDLKEFESLALDADDWNYDEAIDCYWQLGLNYCKKPSTEVYEQLAIYVPGAYFEAEKRGKHYRCSLAEEGKKGAFTASNAPIVVALNSKDFAGSEAPQTFDPKGLKEYLDAGLVYVYVGFRGRSSGFDSSKNTYFSGGSPWSVCDIKAAIRYLRYNSESIPGSVKRIVVMGHGSAGALAAIVGSSGNSLLFEPYLAEIGAIDHDTEGEPIGDSVFGVASWCPLLPAGEVNAAYEWMIGQYVRDDSRAEGSVGQALSEDLAAAYGEYLDSLALVGSDDGQLRLDATGGGIYVAGTYYDALLDALRESFSAFVERSEFPVAISLASQASGKFPGGGESLKIEEDVEEISEASDSSRTLYAYEQLSDYVDHLNGDDRWLTYDEDTGEVRFSDLGSFVEHVLTPRQVCAYDSPDKSLSMNQLYGTEESSSLHFDSTIAELLSRKHGAYSALEGWDESWPSSWREDLGQLDSLENTVSVRRELYDPFTYLVPREGDDEVSPAKHWRIRSGAQQATTSLTSEFALSRALAAHEGVSSCDFSFVWDRAFVPAETGGTPAAGLAAWLEKCTEKKKKS